MYTKEVRVRRLRNRIAKLGVNPDNNKILAKCKRQLRKYAA